MTISAEVIIEAREIPSLEGLADRVEQETTSILSQEREEILSTGNLPQYKSIVDIAEGITKRIILPYLLIHGLAPYRNHEIFLVKFAKLGEIKNRGDSRLAALDNSVHGLLKFLGGGLKEAYEMLYQGCCDIHFQRVCGVSTSRSDCLLDYVQISRKIRPGRDSRRDESYVLKGRFRYSDVYD